MKYIVLILTALPFLTYGQNDTGIKIELNSGQTLYTNYVYVYSGLSNSYVKIDGKKGQKIPINTIKYVEGFDNSGNQRYFRPIRVNYNYQTWGERIFMSERIQIYSTSGFDFNNSAAAGDIYSKDNMNWKGIKYKNLKKDLSDGADAMKSLRQANGYRLTQLALWTASAGIFLSGVNKAMSDDELKDPEESMSIPSEFIVSSVVGLAGWLLYYPKQKKLREALKKYK